MAAFVPLRPAQALFQRVMGHELACELFRKRRVEPTSDVDGCQFLVLAPVVCFEFGPLKRSLARSVSDCECAHTYSPAAMDVAPATRPATPATNTLL